MFFHHVPLDCLRAVWFKAVKDDKTPLFPLPLHNPTPSPPLLLVSGAYTPERDSLYLDLNVDSSLRRTDCSGTWRITAVPVFVLIESVLI